MVAIWFFRPFVFWLIGLEFSDSNLEFDYKLGWKYVLPVCILVIYLKNILESTRKESFFSVLATSLTLSVLSYGIAWLTVFTGMCGWFDREEYFYKNDGMDRVVLMEFGCGAGDSDTKSKREIRKVARAGEYFQWNHSCDTTKMKLKDWQRR